MNAQQRKKTKGSKHVAKVTQAGRRGRKPAAPTRSLKTSSATQTADKPVRRQARYDPAIAARVKMLIVEMGCVNQRGDIAWERIARMLSLGVETLRNWRKESSLYYQADFAAAVKEAVAAVDTGGIKRGLINAAKPHAVVKRIRALRRGKMKLIREERTVEIDTAAAKFVLPNYGPPAERWTVKEQRTHDVTDEFAKLLQEIGEQPLTLPCQETNGPGRAKGKAQKPILEAESPVLDHG